MNVDLNTAATIVTVVVVSVTAIAAFVQLRHMRTANQLEALLTVLARVEHADFGRMVDGARLQLAEKLPDPAYRRSIEEGKVDRTNNPWLTLGNSYEWVGSLVRSGLVDEDPYMDIYADRVVYAWEIMQDAIAIVRRRGGPSVLENFEYLYVRAKAYAAKHPNGVYPSHTPRAELHDRWADADAKAGKAEPANVEKVSGTISDLDRVRRGDQLSLAPFCTSKEPHAICCASSPNGASNHARSSEGSNPSHF